MSEKKDFVYICGSVHRLNDLATDPLLRAKVLDEAKRKRATKQYRHLIHLLAERDAATGAVPLVLKKIGDCPERTGRQQLAVAKGRAKPGFFGAKQFAAAKRREEAERNS